MCITTHLRHKASEAVDARVSRVVIDMSQLKTADMTLIKVGIIVIRLCVELDIQYSLIGSEVVRAECKNYEETKDWQFIGSVEEAAAVYNGKTLPVA